MKKLSPRPALIFKTGISETEYEKIDLEFFSETKLNYSLNIYFDTSLENPKLFPERIRLRLKIYKNKFRLELKLKGLDIQEPKEIHEFLNKDTYKNLIRNGIIPKGQIKERLHEICQNQTFIIVGKAKNFTKKIKHGKGLFILDHSIYKNKEEYEFELRSDFYKISDTNKILSDFDLQMHDRVGKLKNIWKNTTLEQNTA